MVQQRASGGECCRASSGDGIMARSRRRRRDAAIVAIKTQLLRCCSRPGDRHAGQRRFKRPYYAAAGDRGDAAVLYLACLVSMYRVPASSRLAGVDDDLPRSTTTC
ncbi:hypothetical protein BS78_07G027700 [Paspalum vaginatum]|nr:hypothetical protein BS78_07G027700 [Paspalum vaginatum]